MELPASSNLAEQAAGVLRLLSVKISSVANDKSEGRRSV